MRFAYADPPYLGCGRKLYGDLHHEAAEYDDPEAHRRLVDRLCSEYPDGWAMSLSSPSLRVILPMCPDNVRVLSWVKPMASFKVGVDPGYAWEPVILRGGRKATRGKPTTPDWLSCSARFRSGLRGSKPAEFYYWIFRCLKADARDGFDDLFPGTRMLDSAWANYLAQTTLFTLDASAG